MDPSLSGPLYPFLYQEVGSFTSYKAGCFLSLADLHRIVLESAVVSEKKPES